VKFITEKPGSSGAEHREAVLELSKYSFRIAKILLNGNHVPDTRFIIKGDCLVMEGYRIETDEEFFKRATIEKDVLEAAINEVKHLRKLLDILKDVENKEVI